MKFYNPFRRSNSNPDAAQEDSGSSPVLVEPLDYDDSNGEHKKYATFCLPALDNPILSTKPSSPSPDEAAESPPSYTLLQGSAGNPDPNEIISVYERVLEEERAALISQPTRLAVERLLHFLRYTLAIDYNAKVKDVYLSSADGDHYLEIALTIRSLGNYWVTVVPSLKDKQVIGAFLWHHVHAPARALGLPIDLVILAIQRFESFRTTLGLYKGCIDGLAHSFSVTVLAGKFHLDQKIMIPAVALNPEMKSSLLKSAREYQDLYFKSLGGMSSLFDALPDDAMKQIGRPPNAPVNLERYELTALMKRIITKRERAIAWVPPNQTVRDCLKKLQARQQEELDREKAGKGRLTAAPPKMGHLVNPAHYDDEVRFGWFTAAPATDFWRGNGYRPSRI